MKHLPHLAEKSGIEKLATLARKIRHSCLLKNLPPSTQNQAHLPFKTCHTWQKTLAYMYLHVPPKNLPHLAENSDAIDFQKLSKLDRNQAHLPSEKTCPTWEKIRCT